MKDVTIITGQENRIVMLRPSLDDWWHVDILTRRERGEWAQKEVGFSCEELIALAHHARNAL